MGGRTNDDDRSGLRVRGLTKRYGDRQVLDGVDLDVPAGRVVVVTGDNGAGKSTFLRCVVGADLADSGTSTLDGAPVDERDPGTRRALAASLDDADLVPELTVREHLSLFAAAHGVPGADDVVATVLADLRLLEVADRPPAGLSSGERQRALLAATAVRPFRLLVLDEPEQRLDAAGGRWLRRHLRRAAAAGAAVLVASHDRHLAADVGGTTVAVGR